MHALGLPTCAIVMKFGMRGDIADVIIHAKFNINRFMGLGVLTPQVSITLYRLNWSLLQQCKHSRATL